MATETLFKFNGNVRNWGLIDNLPEGCVRGGAGAGLQAGPGAHPCGQDRRASCALLTGTSAQIEEMVVEGSLAGDREMIYQAICYDPLTAAVLSLREIRAMVDEMFQQNKEWLTQFK